MPRVPHPVKNKAKSPNKYKDMQNIRNFLGETSSATESFHSPNTDQDETDYNLDFTSKTPTNRIPTKPTPNTRKSSLISIPAQRIDNSNTQSRNSSRRKQKKPQRKPHILHEIKKLSNSSNLLIPKRPFYRLIREILLSLSVETLRITPVALEALQESAEIYLTHLFQDSYACTLHRDRKTLSVKDISLVRFIRGQIDPGNI